MSKRTIPFDIGDEVVIKGVIESIFINEHGEEEYSISIRSGGRPVNTSIYSRVTLLSEHFKLDELEVKADE